MRFDVQPSRLSPAIELFWNEGRGWSSLSLAIDTRRVCIRTAAVEARWGPPESAEVLTDAAGISYRWHIGRYPADVRVPLLPPDDCVADVHYQIADDD
jgi:hypothetical protein